MGFRISKLFKGKRRVPVAAAAGFLAAVCIAGAAGCVLTRENRRAAALSRELSEILSDVGSVSGDGVGNDAGNGDAAGEAGTADREPPAERESGRRELRALKQAYPERITEVAQRDGEWAARMESGGEWFYWEEGRLLPEGLREHRDQFSGIRFYAYVPGPYHTPIPDAETAERLREMSARLREEPPQRFPGFFDALYGVSSAAEADSLMVKVRFLGHTARVHPMIAEALRRAGEEIERAAETDGDVMAFVAGIDEIGGFSWREIAGTKSRSYHSYGAAVDIVPKSYGGAYSYWRWAMTAGIAEWWNLPESRRWHVPQAVIDAFERNDFVWGGKWLFFDSIHFEYRPEIFLLPD